MNSFLLAALLASAPGGDAAPFEAPFRVKAGESWIDVEVGHAAPLWYDWDGDGLEDLLVGQFGEGKLRIYRNVGKKGAPAFRDFTLFPGKIPSG